jgi:hypothetical protein
MEPIKLTDEQVKALVPYGYELMQPGDIAFDGVLHFDARIPGWVKASLTSANIAIRARPIQPPEGYRLMRPEETWQEGKSIMWRDPVHEDWFHDDDGKLWSRFLHAIPVAQPPPPEPVMGWKEMPVEPSTDMYTFEHPDQPDMRPLVTNAPAVPGYAGTRYDGLADWHRALVPTDNQGVCLRPVAVRFWREVGQ